MKSEASEKKETSVIRVELRYCPRCGALSIGTAEQYFCTQCVGALRWLYAKAQRPAGSGARGES